MVVHRNVQAVSVCHLPYREACESQRFIVCPTGNYAIHRSTWNRAGIDGIRFVIQGGMRVITVNRL